MEPAQSDADPLLTETRDFLTGEARGRFGAIPPEILADHVLAWTTGADFPVREAAMDALVRRFGFAKSDELTVAARPPRGTVLGAYTTERRARSAADTPSGGAADTPGPTGTPPKRRRRKKTEARPYTSVLEGVTRPRGSCDCPDFLRSSLGLCKHLLVVLDDVFSSPKRLRAAARDEARESEGEPGARLSFDPRIALGGRLDRLAGLRLDGRRVARLSRSRLAGTLGLWFATGSPPAAMLDDLGRRSAFLQGLSSALRPAGLGRSLHLEATPAARAIVEEEAARTRHLLACEQGRDAALATLSGLRRGLYPYQREGVERLLSCGRLLLADDMGLGKTMEAIAACHALYHAGKVRRGLLIVPASLKAQWLREWEITTDAPARIVDGNPAQRARQYRSFDDGFLIINYEQLLRDIELVRSLALDMVVLDEAQRIKNYATKSAVYVKALTPTYRLVLTGTPMENRLEELASLLDWVDDVALAPKWRLVPWYTLYEGDGGSGKAGARNLDTLRLRLSGCMLRRVRREVLAQLPPRTDTRVPVEMTTQQQVEHDELNQPIAKYLRIAQTRPLRQPEFLRLMLLLTQQRIFSNGLGQARFEEIWPTYSKARPDPALLEGLFAPKLGELRRLVADIAVGQERKIVVFSQWRRMLRLAEWSIRDILGDAGLRAVFFTGAEKPAQRTRAVTDLHDDPSVRVMFLSDAGGVGLNLQHAATACINLELPWNPAVLEQRIGRIYRLGQKRPIDVYNLVSEYGIESRIAAIVGTKSALFTGLFDGTSDEIRFDSSASFLSRVEQLVDLGRLPEAPDASGLTSSSSMEPLEDSDSEPREPDGNADTVVELEGERPPRAIPDASAAPGPSGADRTPVLQLPPTPELAPQPSSGEPSRPANPVRDVAALFAALRVERTPTGGVLIEAPPEAASSLAALFEGMARLMMSAAAPTGVTETGA